MERELIFWVGCTVLGLVGTGGFYMFFESKPTTNRGLAYRIRRALTD